MKWLDRWNDLLANVEESLVRIMEIKALDRRLQKRPRMQQATRLSQT